MELHPQLLKDCILLGRLPQTEVLLHRNATVPWLILVPDTDAGDLLDLPVAFRDAVVGEAAIASETVKQVFGLQKVNFAAIGNVVPQLHLHVVGRHPQDACWPKPVWGNLTEQIEYAPEQIKTVQSRLQQLANVAGQSFVPATEL
ncbi:HIT domain-containing protein [Planctomicrobium sp. SH527]|uniref:HIT domain-containing protein n=1 Tax=Planctomicrobium sp. SH527 TaxID=3448123 RepID=UPI003F5B50C3